MFGGFKFRNWKLTNPEDPFRISESPFQSLTQNGKFWSRLSLTRNPDTLFQKHNFSDLQLYLLKISFKFNTFPKIINGIKPLKQSESQFHFHKINRLLQNDAKIRCSKKIFLKRVVGYLFRSCFWVEHQSFKEAWRHYRTPATKFWFYFFTDCMLTELILLEKI